MAMLWIEGSIFNQGVSKKDSSLGRCWGEDSDAPFSFLVCRCCSKVGVLSPKSIGVSVPSPITVYQTQFLSLFGWFVGWTEVSRVV